MRLSSEAKAGDADHGLFFRTQLTEAQSAGVITTDRIASSRLVTAVRHR